jgi:hypothetical protein
VRTCLNVFWCLFLLCFSWVSVAGAQQQPPAAAPGDPPADQSAVTSPENSPQSSPQSSPQTTPPTPQTTPPTAPPTAPQNPATNPPDQTPLAQPPRIGLRQPPPPLPKVPDIRQPGETGYWISVTAWFPTTTPTIDKGHAAAFTQPSLTKLQGKPNFAQGVDAGIALGLHNALRLSYFESRAAGSFTNANDIELWSQLYTAGNLVSTNYRMQNFKLSFEYLTWPYPVESRTFRFKTLYQLQYTSVRTTFDLPLLPLVDSTGAPLVDVNGNPLSYAGEGTRAFFSPTLGVGVAKYFSRNFRLEANATGFAIPHHTTIWDTDASANLRLGHFELRVGAKAFHFKTSTQAEFFVKNTMASAFVGLRWYSD